MKLLKRALSAAVALAMSTVLFIDSASEVEVVTAADAMRDMTSQEIVTDMGLGWNLGNTFDSFYSGQTMSPSAVETAWGNPTVTKELIQAVKGYGFKTIRVPVTWMNCIDSSNNINTAYLDRVQEVVDYCINEGLYVIVNMHHDGSDDSSNWIRAAQNDYDGVSAKYVKIWTQIAERFADYSDYLVFESMNEVAFDTNGSPTSENYTTLNNLNQLFVDTIRGTGSNNANRHLLIAGYITDIDKTCDNRYTMPTDPAGRCILSVHYYTPSDFCVAESSASWCTPRTTWGTDADYTQLTTQLDKITSKFVNAGVPVIIGEYGVLTEAVNNKDSSSIAAYLGAVAEESLKRGICPVLWDSGNGGDMRYINRTSKTWNNTALETLYKNLASEYTTAATTPVVTKPSEENNSVKVTATTNTKGNKVIDLSPYEGKLITGVGFTVNGDVYEGNGGVLIGFTKYDSSVSWGGSYAQVQAPFLGADVGQLTKYMFDAENEDSIDPKEIMYDGQTMQFSISWTYGTDKTSLSLGDEFVLYFNGAGVETTTDPLAGRFEERVTAVVTNQVGVDDSGNEFDRPVMEIDISKYKGNKLVGVEFSLTGTHKNGGGAVSYNLIDETADDGTKWSYVEFGFKEANDAIQVAFDPEEMAALDYDFLRFNIWWETGNNTSADYSFSPDVILYFENEVVIQTTVTTTEGTPTTETSVTTTTETTPTETTPTIPTGDPDNTVYGDVDCSGKIEIADVVTLNKYQLDDTTPISAQGLANADCEYDQKITMADSSKIINYLAKIITEADLGPQG